MIRKVGAYGFLWIMVALFLLLGCSTGTKELKVVKEEVVNFSLPSSQDRLANYADDYYGKYHLIMTFFPAAFTPI